MRIDATGFGTAVISSLMGILARQISLEVIPVCILEVKVQRPVVVMGEEKVAEV